MEEDFFKKSHDSVVPPLSPRFTKVNPVESHGVLALKAKSPSLPTKGWLLGVALPSTPDKSGQPAEEGSSLLEQGKSKERSQRQDGGWLWIVPQMDRQVPARPQNSLSPRRGPVDSSGHLQTAYFKLICSRHARAAAGRS